MKIELNDELLSDLLEEDSVAIVEIEEEAEEIAETMPDEYCDPMAEFRMI